MTDELWHDLGDAAELAKKPLQPVLVGRTKAALSFAAGSFGIIHNTCNHAGGPLEEGTLDGDYVVCPWHNYKFHRVTGEGEPEPGYEDDRVPRFEFKVEADRLLVRDAAVTTRNKPVHDPHPLDRDTTRVPGPLRVAGISTTNMDNENPRYSTSETLLESALEHVRGKHALEVRMVKLGELSFRACEGYYSKSARACTWPCSISQMDADDGMNAVYDSLVFWADVVLVATPIRWGAASSLYFRMAERLNTVQNQITIRDRVMLKNKVAGFIVIGGQDNIQAVAGQMLQFFPSWACSSLISPTSPTAAAGPPRTWSATSSSSSTARSCTTQHGHWRIGVWIWRQGCRSVRLRNSCGPEGRRRAWTDNGGRRRDWRALGHSERSAPRIS